MFAKDVQGQGGLTKYLFHLEYLYALRDVGRCFVYALLRFDPPRDDCEYAHDALAPGDLSKETGGQNSPAQTGRWFGRRHLGKWPTGSRTVAVSSR